MNKSISAALVFLLICNLVYSLWLGFRDTNKQPEMLPAAKMSDSAAQRDCIQMYIGLNDPKTNKPAADMNTAKKLVSDICMNEVGGYTIMEAEGGWADKELGPQKQETLVCFFYDIDPETVKKAADRIKKELNQQPVLLIYSKYLSEYY